MLSLDRTSSASCSRNYFLAILAVATLLLSACGGAYSSGAKTIATAITTATPAPSITSVYASAGDNALYALRADSGVVRWKYQAKEQPQLMGLGDNSIYSIDPSDRLLSAISQADGTLLWKSQAQVCDSVGLARDATRVYVPVIQQEGASFMPVVYALDAKTGATVWIVEAGAAQQSVARANCANLAVSTDTLYTSSFGQLPNDGPYTSVVTAYKLSDQTRLWRFENDDQLFAPVVSEGSVYISGRSSVYAIDSTSGKTLWVSNGAFPQGYVSVVGSLVYAGYGGPHYAFDRATGKRSTEQPFCALTPDVAYICDKQQIAALKTVGWNVLWQHQTSANVWQAITVGKRAIYTDDQHIGALDTETGKSLWETPTPFWHFTLASADGEIFGVSPLRNGATIGMVYAFDAATGAQRWTHELPTSSDSSGYVSILVG